MKVAFFGRSIVIQKLLDSLGGNGLQVSVAPEATDGGNVLGQIDSFDLAIVDSLAQGADETCHSIEQCHSVPMILVVKGGRQADWRKLQTLDAQGYLYEAAGKEELAARMRAIMRRLKPSEPLKNVTFTWVPEAQMAGSGITL